MSSYHPWTYGTDQITETGSPALPHPEPLPFCQIFRNHATCRYHDRSSEKRSGFRYPERRREGLDVRCPNPNRHSSRLPVIASNPENEAGLSVHCNTSFRSGPALAQPGQQLRSQHDVRFDFDSDRPNPPASPKQSTHRCPRTDQLRAHHVGGRLQCPICPVCRTFALSLWNCGRGTRRGGTFTVALGGGQTETLWAALGVGGGPRRG